MSNNATMNTLNVRNLNWKINNFSSGSQTTTTTTVFCLPSSSNLSSGKKLPDQKTNGKFDLQNRYRGDAKDDDRESWKFKFFF